MRIKQLDQIIGGKSKGLSNPGKMPCKAFNIPAAYCNIGAKLRQIIGSVCSICYALKGRYVFPVVLIAMERRYERFIKGCNNERYIAAFAELVTKQSPDYFRWFDSGDLPSLDCLIGIVKIAILTPNTKHWLPTREYKIVRDYIEKYGAFPPNLVVRVSIHMLGQNKRPKIPNVVFSGVAMGKGNTCQADQNNHKCGPCRACWDKRVKLINYPKG